MHTINRFAVTFVLLVALIPLGTLAYIATGERDETERAFREALKVAVEEYSSGRGLQALLRRQTEAAKTAAQHAGALARDKRALRLQVAALQKKLQNLQIVVDTDSSGASRFPQFVEEGREDILSFVRSVGPLASAGSDSTGITSLRRVLVASIGGSLEEDLRMQKRREILAAFLEEQKLEDLRAQYAALSAEYLTALEAQEDAVRQQQFLSHRLEEIKRTVAEVHEQVLRMQGELARIDARIRSRAERDLVEKGLLDTAPSAEGDGGLTAGPQFGWPAYGAISAGFLNKEYEQYFGIPHKGMDITAPQGSPVFSAADGVVFLVHDGGADHYSYILIGHRDGYATLYGHLSSLAVSAGQFVMKGEAIGLSGGTPGTRGAGPTTTGPHLHFEVIQSGTNIDPKSVLP
ncbi:MAG: peptidoglycan DD-metalloendopeptidase family protein [Candidatus Peribacteraceae bacterium]|nr:peptidoglycan DD-metalloendopeptidase family protein [Candidatus Peribacteraceae bacterium]